MTQSPLSLLSVPLPRDVAMLPDEKVVHVVHFHAGIYWKGLAVFAIAFFLMLRVFNLGIFLMVVAAVMLGLAYITKHYLLLILTNRRILLRSGLLRMDTVQLPLDRLESVEIERTPMAMIMGYGSVVLTGTGSRVMAVPFVAAPHVFRRLADELIYARDSKESGGN